MPDTGLKIDARRKKILELIMRDGQVRVRQLAEMFGATPVTIRSDLQALEADGYLQRVAGGAAQTVRNLYNVEFQRRRQLNAEFKRAVAAAAAEMVEDGQTLLINSGATTLYLATALKTRKGINVVTNSLSVAVELGGQAGFRVILLGGDINARYGYTHGTEALEQLRHYKADYAMLSLDGVDAAAGLTSYHADEAAIDRAMMERARRVVIPADFSKLGHESFTFVAEARAAAAVITNVRADATPVEALRGIGVAVTLCGPAEADRTPED